jgi:hypothetical protein
VGVPPAALRGLLRRLPDIKLWVLPTASLLNRLDECRAARLYHAAALALCVLVLCSGGDWLVTRVLSALHPTPHASQHIHDVCCHV